MTPTVTTSITEDVFQRALTGEVFIMRCTDLSADVAQVVRWRIARIFTKITSIPSSAEDITAKTASVRPDVIEKVNRRLRISFSRWPISAKYFATLISDTCAKSKLIQRFRYPILIPPSVDPVEWIEFSPPHKDSWYGYPKETVNLWLACSSAKEAGLQIFLNSIDTVMRFKTGLGKNAGVYGTLEEPKVCDQFPPMKCTPETGEVLIFCTDALHSSLPNTGLQTRIAIDYRVIDRRVASKRSQWNNGVGRFFLPVTTVLRCPPILESILLSDNPVSRRITQFY